VDILGNYIVKADLQTYGVDLGSYSDDNISAFIDQAEELIEKVTSNKFYTEAATRYFDGNGKRRLFFQPVTSLRLQSITSCNIVDPTDNDTVHTTLTENTEYFLDPQGYYVELPLYLQEQARTWLGYGVWPEGTRNVKIVGTWGETSVPESIKWAAALLVARRIDPDFSGLDDATKTSEKWSDYSVTYAKPRSTGSGFTGVRQVDEILRLYRNKHTMVVAL
jgi:hypothetical protein